MQPTEKNFLMSQQERDLFLRQQAGLPAKHRGALLVLHAFDDPPAPSPYESTRSTLDALTTQLPRLMNAANQQILPNELAMLRAQQQIAPETQALNAQLYAQYAPVLNQVGQRIANSNALNQAQNDASILQGPGQQVISAATQAQRLADPEYYRLREQLGQGVGALLSGLGSPNALSGGEEAQVERGLNRMNIAGGNYGNRSPITTVNNAMTFGDALNQRRQNQATIFGTTAGMLPATRSGTDVFQMVTGRPSAPSQFGQGQFTGVNQVGQNSMNMTNSLLGSATGFQNSAMDINANRRTFDDRINNAIGSLPSCCFIFMEAYNGQLPETVRLSRDFFYAKEPLLASGYKRMAKWLVPLMRTNKVVRSLTNWMMIKPLTVNGEWLFGRNKYGYIFNPVRYFWFSIWRNSVKGEQ